MMVCDGELVGYMRLIIVKYRFHREWILGLDYGLPHKSRKKIGIAKFSLVLLRIRLLWKKA